MAQANALRQRTLTAFTLGPLVLGAVLWLPGWAFAVFLGVIVLASAWEWGALAGADSGSRWAYLAGMIAVLLVLWWMPDLRPWVFGAGFLWWLAQAVRISRIRAIEQGAGFDGILLGAGILVLAAAWAALVDLHQGSPDGRALVLFLLFLVWTADSLAFFVGRRFGHAKLAPVVSPGKTRAGLYGALLGATLWGLVLGVVLTPGGWGLVVAVLLCLITVGASVVGDLYESLLKRRRCVKDSSHLLPGHGGLLDRVDSLTAAAPVFVVGLYLMGLT